MLELIYCKNFTNAPRDCGGIAYQVTYDQHGVADGAYRCNFCYREKFMSEHSVLLATQKKVEKLETENAELRAYIIRLETALDGAFILVDYWRDTCHDNFNREHA